MPLSKEALGALPIGAAVALTPLVIWALARMVPPRRALLGEYDELKERYGRLELAAALASMLGVCGVIAGLVVLRKDGPWMVGLLFGAIAAAPVALVAAVILPSRGLHWGDYWRYYELRYGIGLRLMGPVHGAMIGLGVYSAARLFP